MILNSFVQSSEKHGHLLFHLFSTINYSVNYNIHIYLKKSLFFFLLKLLSESVQKNVPCHRTILLRFKTWRKITFSYAERVCFNESNKRPLWINLDEKAVSQTVEVIYSRQKCRERGHPRVNSMILDEIPRTFDRWKVRVARKEQAWIVVGVKTRIEKGFTGRSSTIFQTEGGHRRSVIHRKRPPLGPAGFPNLAVARAFLPLVRDAKMAVKPASLALLPRTVSLPTVKFKARDRFLYGFPRRFLSVGHGRRH